MLQKLSKKKVVAARLESYHRGYHLGFRSGTQSTKGSSNQPKRKVRKSRTAKKFKRVDVAARIEVYREGYQRGVRSGLLQERVEQVQMLRSKEKTQRARMRKRNTFLKKAAEESALKSYKAGFQHGACSGLLRERHQQEKKHGGRAKAWKATRTKLSRSLPKSLAAARLDAYMRGVNTERARREHGKVFPPGSSKAVSVPARPRKAKMTAISKPPSSAVFTHDEVAVDFNDDFDDLYAFRPLQHPRLREKTSVLSAQDVPKSSPLSRPTSSMPAQAASTPLHCAEDPMVDILGSPTPVRAAPSVVRSAASSVACSLPKDKAIRKGRRAARQMECNVFDEPSYPALVQVPSGITANGATDALRYFLENLVNVTEEPAAFQLRCQQYHRAEDTSPFPQKVVIIVSGKCKLWKLNQIIGECFDASEQKFVYEARKGATVLGSHFQVSRPIQPGQCSKVIVSSISSALHISNGTDFIGDHEYNVAQLFRGKSTRYALEQEAGEAAQKVVFSSPLLGGDVSVSLDGIMLDSYDSYNLFDKNRRHGNGQTPLPRMVSSSFLSIAEIEAKNIVLQGPREGPQFLSQFDTSWSAIHARSRRSQRKPLFRKDGRDFDLPELCHAIGEEDADSDLENHSGNSQQDVARAVQVLQC